MNKLLDWLMAAIAVAVVAVVLISVFILAFDIYTDHHKPQTATQPTKARDTIRMGGDTFVEVRRQDTTKGYDGLYSPGNGKIYRRLSRDTAERRAGK